jgi:hypothetical protein
MKLGRSLRGLVSVVRHLHAMDEASACLQSVFLADTWRRRHYCMLGAGPALPASQPRTAASCFRAAPRSSPSQLAPVQSFVVQTLLPVLRCPIEQQTGGFFRATNARALAWPLSLRGVGLGDRTRCARAVSVVGTTRTNAKYAAPVRSAAGTGSPFRSVYLQSRGGHLSSAAMHCT